MAEMNQFEDLEAQLRRLRPVGPRKELRDTVLQAAGSRRRYRLLWGLAKAAAAAALLAVNLATDRYSACQLEALTGNVGPSPAVSEARELLRSLNGYASEWFLLAASFPATRRGPAQGVQAGQVTLEEIPE